MRLPDHDDVTISDEKVRDYLLGYDHPVGHLKAAFFAAAGFERERWQSLAEAIRTQLAPLDVEPGRPSTFGSKYETSGWLTGPNGRRLPVVAVWIVRHGETARRLVTLYPGAMSRLAPHSGGAR